MEFQKGTITDMRQNRTKEEEEKEIIRNNLIDCLHGMRKAIQKEICKPTQTKEITSTMEID